jgi:glycosyltransferase involved in cell wall biosynthesis
MKDHAGFLRAAAIVAQDYPHARFVLAGTGISAKQPALAEGLKQNGLQGSLTLLGERSDIRRLNNAFDIGYSASALGRRFFNPIGEAMASGVPCAVMDVGDSAYIVGDSGLVTPSREPQALANAIMHLIDMRRASRQQLGAKARKRIQPSRNYPKV